MIGQIISTLHSLVFNYHADQKSPIHEMKVGSSGLKDQELHFSLTMGESAKAQANIFFSPDSTLPQRIKKIVYYSMSTTIFH